MSYDVYLIRPKCNYELKYSNIDCEKRAENLKFSLIKFYKLPVLILKNNKGK